MFIYPEKKKYLYTIETELWDVSLFFDQATAEETKDYFSMLEAYEKWNKFEKLAREKKIEDYFFWIITKNIVKIKKNKRYHTKRKLLLYIKRKSWEFCVDMVSTMHTQRKSVYSNLPRAYPKWSKNQKNRTHFFQSDLQIMKDKTGVSADKINEVFTAEQIWRWIDKATYDFYESFDEWQAVNNMLIKQTWLSKEQQELLDYIDKTK